MGGWTLAIDLGSTSTRAATAVEGEVSLVELDGRPSMRSGVFWPDDGSGRFVFGEAGRSLGRLQPDRYLVSPLGQIGQFVLLGGDQLRATEAIGAVLRHVVDQVTSSRGGAATWDARLVYPAQWQQQSLTQFAEAASFAGLESPRFIPEPVAAAVF